jgi:thiol-disulfide isomerase/thioredoxin
MKTPYLVILSLAFVVGPLAVAVDEKPKPEATAPETPEAAIEKIEGVLNADDPEGAKTVEEANALWQKRLVEVDGLLTDFRKRFATHPLRWKALFLEANAREIREELELPIAKESRPVMEIYAEIIGAPDADMATKSEASSARLLAMMDQVSNKKTPLEDWEKQLAQHLKAFPEYEENVMLVEMRLMLVSELANARLVPLLEDLAKSPTPTIAELAQSRLAMAKTLAELKSKPLDLKFKALDETDVDLEKLRGKVVLVDFWATWCGPCMIELPKVVKTYGKLKDKGFEIIGISLDEDEAELKRVIKAKQITWPQYFDGKGWENPYAKKYGVDGIPAMWLVNKKGMVVDIEAQDDLEAKVEKLLAE